MRQRGFAVEIFDEAALPHRREIERGNEGGEQADVADADLRRAHAVLRRGFKAEREHFGVGGGLVGAAETLDAGLEEFTPLAFAVTKHRAEVAKARRFARRRRSEIGARYRNGQVGTQTQFASVRIGGEEHAPADVLAGKVKERLGGLQHRRLDLRITGAHIGADERLRPRIRTGL